MKFKSNLLKIIFILAFLCLFPLSVASLAFAESQGASGVTTQTIIDRARYYIAGTGDAFWTDATEMLAFANAGIIEIADTTKCLDTTEQITLLTGVTKYAISSNYFSVEKAVYSGAIDVNTSNYKGLEKIDIGQVGLKTTIGAGEPVYFYVWNDTLYVDPVPSSGVSGYKIMLYLSERPSGVTISEAIPTPASYDEALVLFVASRAAAKARQWDRATQLYALYRQVITLHLGRSQTLEGDKVK